MRLLSIATCGLLVFATPSPTQARATGGMLFVPEAVGPPVVIVDVKPLRVYHNGAWEGFIADEAVTARAVILTSPNGTRYQLLISDDGQFGTEPI